MVGERVARGVGEDAAPADRSRAVTFDLRAGLRGGLLADDAADVVVLVEVRQERAGHLGLEPRVEEHLRGERAHQPKVVPAARARKAGRRGVLVGGCRTRDQVGAQVRLDRVPDRAVRRGPREVVLAPAVGLAQHPRLERTAGRLVDLGHDGGVAIADEGGVAEREAALRHRDAQERGAVVLGGPDDRIGEAAVRALQEHVAGGHLVGERVGPHGEGRPTGRRRGRGLERRRRHRDRIGRAGGAGRGHRDAQTHEDGDQAGQRHAGTVMVRHAACSGVPLGPLRRPSVAGGVRRRAPGSACCRRRASAGARPRSRRVPSRGRPSRRS